MKLQKLYSYVRRALDDYGLIQNNDKIAIGISGGKDSLTLLYALAGIREFYPINFQIVAITVDLGFNNMDYSKVQKLCEELQVEYHIISTQIAQIVFEERTESSPCALCAKMRKGALISLAKELGCTKIAYAHHMEDFIETSLLSLLFEGRFYCFPPLTYFEDCDLAVIRPLMYVPLADIIGFKNKYELPIVKNSCPVDGKTKREYVHNLLNELNHEHPGVKKRLFHAILTGNMDDWPKM